MENLATRKSNKSLKSSTLSSEDRISDLPDSIIEHVLLFLDTKDAFKTSVLSKRWESLWTLIPSLMFCCELTDEQDVNFPQKVNLHDDFICFVEKTLTKHASSKIQTFVLQWPFRCIPENRVQSWIQFAVNHKVEDLQLQSTSHYCAYDWPECLYTNSSVTKLSLHSLRLDRVIEGFHWTSLKLLCLSDTHLRMDAIRSVLLGSPQIECLKLRQCGLGVFRRGDSNNVIDTSSTSLKELVLEDVYSCDGDEPIPISAPNLSSLTILQWELRAMFRLANVSCLEKVYMEFSMNDGLEFYNEKMLKNIVQDLSHVKKVAIVLGIWCRQHKSSKAIHARYPLESVEIVLTENYLPGLQALLYSSPNLEQLTINIMPPIVNRLKQKTCCGCCIRCCGSRLPIIEFPISYLRSVEITGFSAESHSNSGKCLVELVEYLLSNASALQKLIIYVEAETSTSATAEITRKLLSLPRLSANAVVRFQSQPRRF